MAFGGTVNRGDRTDPRRFRRVSPLGPNPEGQAKLIGSRTSYQKIYYGNYKPQVALLEETFLGETRNPDMTPVPRLTDRAVQLYLRDRTVTAFEVLGEEDFKDEDF